MTWTADVRESLTLSRREGAEFSDAWVNALADHQPPADWTVDDIDFCEHVMRRAYRGLSPALHPTRLEAPGDTPEGVTRLHTAPAPRPKRTPRCKSGDGCDRVATHGTFGPKFCERHYAELRQFANALKGEGDPLLAAAEFHAAREEAA